MVNNKEKSDNHLEIPLFFQIFIVAHSKLVI